MNDNTVETTLLEIACKEGWSFPLTCPLHYSAKEDDKRCQHYLRFIAFVNQDGICPLCQNQLDNDNAELHHALISRQDVRGTDFSWMIHDARNVLLVHHSCHHQLTRELSLEALSKIFNIKDVEGWYNSLPFKSNFRKLGY
jgi:hypothetical protein